MDNRHLIFVYGTLKRDGGNDAHKRHLGDAKFVGNCSVKGVMVHLGYYPGLVEDSICRVTGEVYEVDAQAIHRMDYYEGTPHNYTRKMVETLYGKAWAYFKNHVNTPLPDGMVCVDRGLWQGGEIDKAPYRQVKDFYENKRWQQPEYRAMAKQPIVDQVPESGAIGAWDDTLKAFVFPDGSVHIPPGVGLTTAVHGSNVVAFPTPTQVKPAPVPPAQVSRGVELM